MLKKTVNSSQNLLGLTGKAREAQNIADVNKSIGEQVAKTLDNDINNIAKQTSRSAKDISEALTTHVENAWDFSIKGDDVLKQLKKGKKTDFFNDEAAKNIVDGLKEYGIKASNDGRYVTLLDNNKNRIIYIYLAYPRIEAFNWNEYLKKDKTVYDNDDTFIGFLSTD